MRELDMKETCSKSLLTNVLDMDDDFRTGTVGNAAPVHHPSHVTGHQNSGFVRSATSYMALMAQTTPYFKGINKLKQFLST